jgi:hypothetical protein
VVDRREPAFVTYIVDAVLGRIAGLSRCIDAASQRGVARARELLFRRAGGDRCVLIWRLPR